MQGEFDLYVRHDSWIHRLDPRVKLAFVVEATLIPFIWPSILATLVVIFVCAAAFWQAQIPLRRIAHIGRLMGPLILLVFALTGIFGGGSEPAWYRLGPLAITALSVSQGMMLGLRLLALALIVFLWLFTTHQATMIRGFQALHMPYEWGLTLALALRYLPIFSSLLTQVREAQQARGLDLNQHNLLQRLRAYRPVLIALVISALRQSEHLGWALEARALGAGGVKRTTFRPLHLRQTDAIVLVILSVVLLGMVLWHVV
jgi:energy-coupling factor transport system permease protein